jgi:hypothetical protein
VTVPLPAKKTAGSAKRPKDEFRRKYMLKSDAQPDLGQSNHLKLMPFQVCCSALLIVFALTDKSSQRLTVSTG